MNALLTHPQSKLHSSQNIMDTKVNGTSTALIFAVISAINDAQPGYMCRTGGYCICSSLILESMYV